MGDDDSKKNVARTVLRKAQMRLCVLLANFLFEFEISRLTDDAVECLHTWMWEGVLGVRGTRCCDMNQASAW